jgi:hypothetical protein
MDRVQTKGQSPKIFDLSYYSCKPCRSLRQVRPERLVYRKQYLRRLQSQRHLYEMYQGALRRILGQEVWITVDG